MENPPSSEEDNLSEQCRIWGEEREEEAIWNVYLKKVRYQRPSSIVQIIQPDGNHVLNISSPNGEKQYSVINGGGGRQNDSDEEITHLMWETVRVKVLKSGTLKKIIEAIHNDEPGVQATHLSVFLATYRVFANSNEILHHITQIYKSSSEDELVKKAMLDCIYVWLDTYPEDFEKGTEGYDGLQKIILPFSQEEGLKSLSLKVQYKLRSRRKMKKSASVQSLRTYCPVSIKTYSLLSIPESHFAQQLTYIDKELFLNLRVWECLGGVWKRRNNFNCSSVVSTVDQFNALSGRVVSTILFDQNATIHQRAKNLDKWIKISQELRHLKNFSSLKAIISGLESNPVFRLSKVWHLISKDRLAIYSQLSQIFSEENNRMAQRTLLETEGTAKYSTPIKNQKEKKFLSRVLRGSNFSSNDNENNNTNAPNGTIPYLGTFLTDLTFLDAALPDRQDDLINFEKRRKEFETLAQLKLLQGSAKGYRIEEDPYFSAWFNSLMVLDDKTAYEMSTQIQPERNHVKGHKKNDSFTSNSSSEINMESSMHARRGSIPSSNESSLLYGATGSNGMKSALSTSNLVQETSTVVKVSTPAKGDVMYKSMMIGNHEHTEKVIAQALEKLGLEDEDARNYNLIQILPQKELTFPSNANIFYALDTSVQSDIRLELRHNGNNNNFLAANSKKNNSISKNSIRST